MKILNKYFWLLTIATLTSCYSLDEEVYTELTSQNVYKTEASAKTVLWSCYDALQNFYAPLDPGYGSTDEIINETWFQGAPMMDYSIAPSEVKIYNYWKNTYSGINRCNVFIENILNKKWETDEPLNWVAEAKVIRAYFYFNLVRIFGEVPLILESTKDVTNSKPHKNSINQIYDQIIIDLNSAKEQLPLASEVLQQPRFSKGTAQGLLMSVYATMAGYPLNQTDKWKDVIKVFEEMQLEDQHHLNQEYSAIFENLKDDVYDTKYREILMEIAYSVYIEGEGGRVGSSMIGDGTKDPYTEGGSWANYVVPKDFYNSYLEGDLRRDWNINKKSLDAIKYKRKESTDYHPFSNPINWVVLRYSDVMLLYAEAINEVNNGPTQTAIDIVNQLRFRARPENEKNNSEILPDLKLKDFTDGNEFKKQIIKERSWELCFEGQRWFDLKRWGLLTSTVRNLANANDDKNAKDSKAAKNITDNHLLYPLPQKELDINPNLLPQNKGY